MLSATAKHKCYTVLDYLSSKTASLGLEHDEDENCDQQSNSSHSNSSIAHHDDDDDDTNPKEILQSN